MRITIACGLDSWSRAGFFKNDGAAVRAVRTIKYNNLLFYLLLIISFGGLEVACWPLVPKFAGSNPAEAVLFLRAKKSSTRLPSEGK